MPKNLFRNVIEYINKRISENQEKTDINQFLIIETCQLAKHDYEQSLIVYMNFRKTHLKRRDIKNK